MLGTEEEEFLREMEKFNYLLRCIQQCLKPHFEMLEKSHSSAVLIFVSFNLDLKLESAKSATWI